MNKRQRRLVNLRWYCDLAIEGARIQRARVLAGGSRHDIDFYLLSVWRLSELARQAATSKVEGAAEVRAAMVERWPRLVEVRDWWVHARSVERTTWFSDCVYQQGPSGSPRSVIHVRHDHDEVEAFYERLCDVLGPLPTEDDMG
ncbi:MAG TPA: hypothetical protein VIR30_03025 [Nocardioides sp.]